MADGVSRAQRDLDLRRDDEVLRHGLVAAGEYRRGEARSEDEWCADEKESFHARTVADGACNRAKTR